MGMVTPPSRKNFTYVGMRKEQYEELKKVVALMNKKRHGSKKKIMEVIAELTDQFIDDYQQKH